MTSGKRTSVTARSKTSGVRSSSSKNLLLSYLLAATSDLNKTSNGIFSKPSAKIHEATCWPSHAKLYAGTVTASKFLQDATAWVNATSTPSAALVVAVKRIEEARLRAGKTQPFGKDFPRAILDVKDLLKADPASPETVSMPSTSGASSGAESTTGYYNQSTATYRSP